MNRSNDAVQVYLSKVTESLLKQGFHVSKDGKFKAQYFELLARRKKWEMEKGGIAVIVYSFALFSSPDLDVLKQYSAGSFKYALKSGGIRPPRGIVCSVWCIPVAIVDSISVDVAKTIQGTSPPKHWSAFEMPVVYDLQQNKLYYCEITPQWGSMYYDMMRNDIKDMLSP